MSVRPDRESVTGRTPSSPTSDLKATRVHAPAFDAQEEDVRTKQALLTAIVVLILFGIGYWLVQEFHKSITAHQCLEQGRRNCPAAEIRAR